MVTVEARGRNANKARGVYKWVPRFSEREVEKRGVVRAREYTHKSHKYRKGLLWSATCKKAQPNASVTEAVGLRLGKSVHEGTRTCIFGDHVKLALPGRDVIPRHTPCSIPVLARSNTVL